MKRKRIFNFVIVIICLCLVSGIAAFFYDARNHYTINSGFTPVKLTYNPDTSASVYSFRNADLTVLHGFVKGIQKSHNTSNLVVRALSPLPSLILKSPKDSSILIQLENINPDYYAKSIEKYHLQLDKIKVNTLLLHLELKADVSLQIVPEEPQDKSSKKTQYIVFGDNRDGYETFESVLQQANGLNPAFVIDNGDLVFSGKPNQYRLFNKTISSLSTTLCTELGNHDIENTGRGIYTMLYGPAYYSFDFSNSHFVFLDSSRGWADKRAIPEEQYQWLERDLKRASGRGIYVITHIPPWDPRNGVTQSKIPAYVNRVKNGEGFIEQKLDNYNESKNMDHGFLDPAEAARFENLMSAYHVNTVYLSHIHSYMDNVKNGVRYLITGGAGAELLSEDSYFHFMIAKVDGGNTATMVELPSPANNYVARYISTANLFITAMIDENPVAAAFLFTGAVLFILLILIRIYLGHKRGFHTFGKWLKDMAVYGVKHFRDLKSSSKSNQ